MRIVCDKKSRLTLCFLAAAGAAAGFCNGFLGAGGGIILLYAFKRLNPSSGTAAQRDNFASVVAAVLPLCVVSAITYSGRGHFDAGLFARLILPAAMGGVCGAFLTDKLNTSLLKNIFAIIVIIAGINMII